jgi:hypothetical protein
LCIEFTSTPSYLVAASHSSPALGRHSALEIDPKLGDDREAEHRYAAASDAILAADGQDKDEPRLNDDAKAKLRRQAVEWLRADLGAWGKMIETGQPQAGAVVGVRLQNLIENNALAGARIGDRLAKLSTDEQKAWRSCWADVDSLLRRAATFDATEKNLASIQSRARTMPFDDCRLTSPETRDELAHFAGRCDGLLDRPQMDSIRHRGLSPCHLFFVCFEGDFGIFERGSIQQGRFPALQIFPKESFDIGFCDG